MRPSPPPSLALRAVLIAIALLAILVPLLLVRTAPTVPRRHHIRPVPQRVVPKAELPPVEPVAFQDLDPQDARSYNADIPFVDGPNPAARPFRLAGDLAARARATDCMAAAVLYEAGDDTVGQRAVAQVVVNRVRHPAFPKTICGVVFQGSERSTGCQFTFACDGALIRNRWSETQWNRARTVAAAALNGTVFGKVGYATHYHTNWVVPYWQASLDKIAAVDTHLFFRWTGWWGTAPAFNRHVSSDEPVIAALAPYSEAHRGAADGSVPFLGAAGPLYDQTAAETPLPPAVSGASGSFLVTLDPDTMSPDGFAQYATRTCGDRAYCKVMGWIDPTKTPATLPLQPSQIASMAFSYLRDRSRGYDKALWNCREFRRPAANQCMKAQTFLTTAQIVSESLKADEEASPAAALPPHVPMLSDGLTGVRRKDAAPKDKSAAATRPTVAAPVLKAADPKSAP
ncbi:cell wall hydrolase [Sphingomonas echinoides]|uniref:cell wall hydrolase n=1 Tax=Sphingomonas echinoides TaxID=59803 RepID=UPI00241322B8|nr:cell wall hydrolase [Sphingomonas echinoides]